MAGNDTFLDILVKSLKSTARFDPGDESAPIAILWPDGDREWEPILPRLRDYLPLLTLGTYDAATRTGPVAYLRCMIARTLPDKLAPLVIPIIYLPGIRAQHLLDLAQRQTSHDRFIELYYRSAVWRMSDGLDWSVAAFFHDKQYGTGISAREDDYTRKAMRRVLPALCELTLDRLHEDDPWKAKDFDALVASIDSLIALGESESLEFKASARWDVRLAQKNSDLEKVVVKEVAGFLNSARGGTLLIGVEDNHHVCGIELDYPTFSKETDRNPDAYERWLMTLLRNTFGPEVAASLHPTFHTANGGTVCKLTIEPAPAPAVVVDKKDGRDDEIFYLRTGNATNRLTLKHTLNYYKTRWAN